MFKNGTLSPPYSFELEFPREKNLVDFLLNKASLHCQKGLGQENWVTNAENGEACQYAEIEPLSRKVASGLFKRGMQRGDVFMYSSLEASKLHVFLLGVWRANGIIRACYPEETQDTLLANILESKVKWFLCDPPSVTEVEAAVQKVPWPVEIIVFQHSGEKCSQNVTLTDTFFQDDGSCCPKLVVEENDTAVILVSSGTTGPSKGAVHTHSGFAKTLTVFQKLLLQDDQQPALCLGKSTHIIGLSFPFVVLSAQRKMLTMKNVNSNNIFHAIHQYRPSFIFGFPKFLLCLVDGEDSKKNYDLSSIRQIWVCGVVVTPSYISRMESLPGVRVCVLYGMTECLGFTATKNFDLSLEESNGNLLPDVPPFSVGKLTPGSFLQVRDLETNKLLGPNQQGELYFKSPFTCTGYFNKPEENKKAFLNGWIKTGDVGYFDENGFIFVMDRCKEMFKYLNDHISPSELENVIGRHEAVNNVCVVGVPDPEGRDTIPRAFVTLKDPNVLATDIFKFANDNLAPYKRLRGGLITLPQLPLGKSGKVNRQILSQMQIIIPKEDN